MPFLPISPAEIQARYGAEYDFLLVEKQNGRSVRMTSKKKFTHAVYWSNHRIACIEPYLEFKLETGDSYSFDIDYTLQ